MKSFYPVIMTDKVSETAEFYVGKFDFEKTFEMDWYVSLKKGYRELAVLDCNHDTVPRHKRGRKTSDVILNFEVDDAKLLYEELVIDQKLPPLLELKDEDFGQRHFIIEDLNGIMIDVIEEIEPSEEFKKTFYVRRQYEKNRI